MINPQSNQKRKCIYYSKKHQKTQERGCKGRSCNQVLHTLTAELHKQGEFEKINPITFK